MAGRCDRKECEPRRYRKPGRTSFPGRFTQSWTLNNCCPSSGGAGEYLGVVLATYSNPENGMNTFHGKLVWSLASVALCVGLSLFPAHHLGAQVKDEKSTPDAASVRKPPASSPGPYCGVYSVYAALRSQGINVRFEDLLQPKYIGSEDGSSLSELQMAARDFGAEAFPLEGLTATSLRAARYPIILHVRRPGKDTPFLHWILFLGNEGNRAHIIDPPNSVETVSFAQLLSLWDGVGLVIAKEPHATRSMFLASWLEQGVVLLLIAVGLGAVRLVLARRNR